MSRSGPLSVAEKFYLDQQYKHETLEEMCRKLDRGKKQVQKYVNTEAKINNPPHVAHSVKNNVGQRDGVTVMTQTAEEIAEAIPKKDPRMSVRYKERVFRPKKEKSS